MKLPHIGVLVPHAGDALLLERIESFDDTGLVAGARARGGPSFAAADGSLPGWSGAELMAQAVSAFATLRAGPPFDAKPGLLLGIRDFRCPGFFPGDRPLRIEVSESTQDASGFGVFDCRVAAGDTRLAEGTLTVYQPDDVFAALGEQLD
jgi:predicted hotdog family 3-hydroxylacyl-ACP dehydratase